MYTTLGDQVFLVAWHADDLDNWPDRYYTQVACRVKVCSRTRAGEKHRGVTQAALAPVILSESAAGAVCEPPLRARTEALRGRWHPALPLSF